MSPAQLLNLTQVASDKKHAGAVVLLDNLRALLAEYHRLSGLVEGDAAKAPAAVDQPQPRLVSLPCFGIKVALTGAKSGSITSKLQEGATGADAVDFLTAAAAVERVILAHACAGVDVASTAYVEGIETAVEEIAERHS